MFTRLWAALRVIGALIVLLNKLVPQPRAKPPDNGSKPPKESDPVDRAAVAYSIVTETNDGLWARIDTLDNGILAVMGIIVAAIFVDADKYQSLADKPALVIALLALTASFFLAFSGWARLFLGGKVQIQTIDPVTFAKAFAEDPSEALQDALDIQKGAWDQIAFLRMEKVRAATGAIGCLLVACALSIAAIIHGKVVQSPRVHCSEVTTTPLRAKPERQVEQRARVCVYPDRSDPAAAP